MLDQPIYFWHTIWIKLANMRIKQSLLILLGIIALPLSAQKIGFIDSDVILKKMPEYNSAQKTIDDLSAQWTQKANEMQGELDQMFRDYKAEEVLLTPADKKAKEDAIVAKESELTKYRESKFGPSGELFKKREELIKPIQDKLYNAVQKVAKKEGLSFILDKAAGGMMLYADEKFDKTFEVMEELGIAVEQENKNKEDKKDK